MPKIDERLLTFAKELRGEMTPAEARLWYHLRAKRLRGIKFVRQSVRRPYIADFVARSHKLIVEIDGDTHAHRESYDARRTAQLKQDGYRVVRFTNTDVIGNEEGVLLTILSALGTAPLPSADCVGSLPLPRGEREKNETPSPLRGASGRPCSQHGLNRPGDGLPDAGGRAVGEAGRGAVPNAARAEAVPK